MTSLTFHIIFRRNKVRDSPSGRHAPFSITMCMYFPGRQKTISRYYSHVCLYLELVNGFTQPKLAEKNFISLENVKLKNKTLSHEKDQQAFD